MPSFVIVFPIFYAFDCPSSIWGKSRCKKTREQKGHDSPGHSERWCCGTLARSSRDIVLIMIRQPDFIFPTVVYELSEVLDDLMEFSAKHLRLGGRLVFWLPVIRELTYETHIPQHPLLRLISNCEQPFSQCTAYALYNLTFRVKDSSHVCEK